jgi:hypothetical protein
MLITFNQMNDLLDIFNRLILTVVIMYNLLCY